MSIDKEMQKPYKKLGDKLRFLREKSQESQLEICGAVEIDLEMYEAIEQGAKRPSEDILLLLANHYSDILDESDTLFKLAGYNNSEESSNGQDSFSAQPAMMILPIDARIVYTDSVNVTANNHGIVMNFMQNAGPNNQTIAISRVGMSRAHAESMLELLQKTLSHTAPKQISPKDSKKSQEKSN
jgi:transcriptional regulator with XRE-family HTH domain